MTLRETKTGFERIVVTGGLTALAFVVALAVGWRRSQRDGVYPFLEVGAALVAAVLAGSAAAQPAPEPAEPTEGVA